MAPAPMRDPTPYPHETQETMHHPTQPDVPGGAPRPPLPVEALIRSEPAIPVPSDTSEVPASGPEYRTDFPASDPFDATEIARPIPVRDEALDPIGAASSSRAPAHERLLGTATPITDTTSEAQLNPCGPVANDDALNGPTHGRRVYQRRKPHREDRRRNRASLTIAPRVYDQARTAFVNASIRGLSLDTMLTLRPVIFESLSPEERHAWTKKRINALRQLFAANENLPEFAALWARESTRVRTKPPYGARGEHVHVLVHAAGGRDVLLKALRKSFGPCEVDVRPADNVVRHLKNGQLGDASTYLLKAVHQNVWRTYPATPHRPSGEIYGPRVGWTRNILDELPARGHTAPKSTKSA